MLLCSRNAKTPPRNGRRRFAVDRVLSVPRVLSSRSDVRIVCSGELPREGGLEAALVGLRIGDGLLELHAGSAFLELDRGNLVVEERSLDKAPSEVGLASTRRPGQRAADGHAGPSQRKADRLLLVGVERVPKR